MVSPPPVYAGNISDLARTDARTSPVIVRIFPVIVPAPEIAEAMIG
jgi:hypothetical protein